MRKSMAREFVEDLERLMESANQRLVGNLSEGYHYIDTDVAITKAMYERNKKEMNNEVFVKFGGKLYEVKHGEYRHSVNQYPEMSIEVEISPRTMVGRDEFEIKRVIFNDPATIVFWTDGTKTVVKAVDEEFDKEKGLAMAIAKKAMGNKGNYFNRIKKWIKE